MSRKVEFLSTIKPILDKKGAKQDAIELARELTDVLSEIDIGADGSGFTELKEIFNAQLAEMGKQPIVFSEGTLKGIVAQFAGAVSQGIKAGVAEGSNAIASELNAQLNALTQRKKALQIEAQKITEKYDKFERYSEMTSLDMDEDIKPLKLEGSDIDEQALSLMDNFIAAEDALSSLKKGTQEYEQALIKAVEAGEQLFQMRLTLEKNKASVRDTTILEDYKLVNLNDTTYDVFNTAESYFTKKLRTWDFRGEGKKISAEIANIDKQIDSLQKNNPDIFQQEQAKQALKTLEEVEAAYKRIATKKGEIKKVPGQNLQIALGKEQETRTLTQLRNDYNKVKDTGNWEDVYTAIARFVNKFESDLHAGKISQDRLPEYTKLYDEFTPIINSVRTTLDLLANHNRGAFSQSVNEGGTNIPQQTVTNAQKKAHANDASADAAEREARALDAQGVALHENVELLREFLSDSKEKGTWYDSKTGRYSSLKTGDDHAITTSMDELQRMSQSFDTGVHSHSYRVAAPSALGQDNDIDTWIKAIDYIKRRAIIAREEVLSFDFSSLTQGELQSIAAQYKEASLSIMRDANQIISNGKIGEEFGTLQNFEEAIQIRLREALERVMQQFPGVMSSQAISLGGAPTASNGVLTPKQKADEVTRNTQDKADARRKELSQQLDSYEGDVLDSRTADENLAKRKEIYDLLQKEGLLTDEIQNKYDLINSRLQVRADLMREAETYYDDVDDLLTGQRVDSVDSAEQYRKDHIQPLDNVIDKMVQSKFFSEDELEDSFMAISRSMEERARNIAAKGVFDELDNNIIDPSTINNAEQLNRVLQERNAILSRVDEMSLIDYDHNAYAEALRHNQLIEERIALLQKENNIEKSGGVPGGASAAEVDGLRQQLEEANLRAADAEERAHSERIDKELAEEALSSTYGSLWEEEQRAKDAEEKVARLQQELAERQHTPSGTLDGDGAAGGAKVAITIEELKGLLEGITFNTKDASTAGGELENAEQGPWALEQTLNTTIKNVLDQIQTNTLKIGDAGEQPFDTSKLAELLSHISPQVTDVGNALATENTLSKIQKDVAAIKGKSNDGAKASGKDGSYGRTYKRTDRTGKEEYFGSAYFPEKLKTQALYLAKFRAELLTTGKLTDEVDEQIYALLDGLAKIKNGPDFSKWSEQFKQLKATVGIERVLDDFVEDQDIETYKQLIALQQLQYDLEIKYEKAKDGSVQKQYYKNQLAHLNTLINTQQIVNKNDEYENKLLQMKADHERKLGAIRASKIDTENDKQVKKEADALKVLLGLYKEYGALDAKWNYSDGTNEASVYERQLKDVYKKIQEQRASMGLSESDTKYDAQIDIAQTAGFNDVANSKLAARAKATDKVAIKQLQDEIKLVKTAAAEIGRLEAQLEFASGAQEVEEINKQIDARRELIDTKKQELMLDQQLINDIKTDAYNSYSKEFDRLAIKDGRAQDLDAASKAQKSQAEADRKEQQKEAETVNKLIGLYKELGQAKARQNISLFSEEQVAQAHVEDAQLRRLIKAERTKLASVDLDTDMRFKDAKATGYRLATTNAERAAAGKATSQRVHEETKAENGALKEQKQIASDLVNLYKQLGQAEAKRDMTSQNSADARIADKEVQSINDQIAAKRQLIKTNNELEAQFANSWMGGIESETKKPIRDLGKEYEKLGKLQAEVEHTPDSEHLQVLKQKYETQKKLVDIESRRLQISDDLRDSYEHRTESAYQSQKLDYAEKDAKARDAARKKTQEELFKQQEKEFKKQVKESQEAAKVTKARSAIDKADNTLLSALSIEGLSDDQIAKLNAYNTQLAQLKTQYNEVRNSDGVVSIEQQQELITQTNHVNALTQEVNELIAQYNRLSGDNATTIGASTLGSGATIDEYQKKLTDAVMAHTNGKASITGFNAATKELSYTIQTGKYEVTEYTAAARQLDNQFVSLQGSTRQLETPMEKLKRKMSEILTYFGGSSLIYQAFGQLRQGIQYVRDIDSALTELKKVTDETEESYDRFLDTAAKTADKVGSTIQKIVSSTADWSRIGYSMEDAAKLAESTSVLLNVSEFSSIDEATRALTSTMQAFGYTAEDSMHVVDIMNEVGNNFAVSSSGIATALQDSASALMAANNSYEEAVSLVAAANRVVNMCHVAIVIW